MASNQVVFGIATAPSQQNEEASAEHRKIVRPFEKGLHDGGSPHLAIVIAYRGQERTTELGLARDVITKLAFEAQFRNTNIAELIGAVVAAATDKDLFQLMLDTEEIAKAAPALDLGEIRIFPNQAKTPDWR